MKKIFKHIILSRYVRYYVAFMGIILIMSMVNFQIIYNTIYQQTISQSYQQLQAAVQKINERIITLHDTAVSLYYYPYSIKMMGKQKFRTEDYMQLLDYRKLLSTTALQGYEVVDYYLYFPNSQITFDKSRIYMSLEENYGKFSNVNNYKIEKFKSDILYSNRQFGKNVTLNRYGINYNVIPYRINVEGSNNMVLCIMLDLQKITETLQSSFGKDVLPFRIIDENQVIYNAGVSDKISYEKYTSIKQQNQLKSNLNDNVLIDVKGDYLDLEFQVLMSKNTIKDLMSDVLRDYVFILGAVSLLASALLIILEINLNKPYFKMVKAQAPVIKTYYLNNLIELQVSDEDLKSSVEHFKIIDKKRAVVCIVRNLLNEDITKAVEKIAEEIFKLKRQENSSMEIICKKEESNQAIIIIYNLTNSQAIVEKVMQTVEMLNDEQQDKKITLAVGNCYETSRGISVSYLEARKVMKYKECHSGTDITFYSQLPSIANVVTLGSETKNKIQVLIASKESERAIRLFEKTFNEQCRDQFVINPVAANNFIAQSASVLIQSIREIVRDKEEKEKLLIEVSKLFSIQNQQKFLDKYSGLIEKISSFVSDELVDDKNQIAKILQYIEQNYSNSSLSLAQLGDVFNMNESYVSQYFKQHTDKNFSQYLEALRMEKAVELLRLNDKTINQIVDEVGYANRNTFYKAFLRVYGVSPKAYKENILNKQNNDENNDI